MAEPTFRTPLAGWSGRFAALAPAVLVGETPVAQLSVRSTDPAVITALGLPGVCSIYRAGDGTEAIWLGPDEWILARRVSPPTTGCPHSRRLSTRPSPPRAAPISPIRAANAPG